MAKSSKSQNPEFLEKRRRAIVEVARRRCSKRVLSPTAALGPAAKRAPVIGPVGYAVRPQPQQN